ncbi:G-protein-signaling modulator 1 [Plectropomus leopardus]|uniref:G-protein-signaling modulator 1 n=1 Tax=Plectropomus leopardus TaxID=160734 RepID=UPI001C4A8F4C|nr:G-protein-signaling modulator 1 [Plectropomus leopardus]
MADRNSAPPRPVIRRRQVTGTLFLEVVILVWGVRAEPRLWPRGLKALRGLVSLVPGPSPDDSSRPRGQSLGSALTPHTRITTSKNKRRSSQQEEPEALLDLILESQAQRLEEQRASLSLLPDPGPPALCGACCPNQPPVPPLDLYYMLIHYQSDRMDDQRCSLPDLEDVVGSVPEGQEDFFSLVQRVQSRRMDEQRASLLLASSEDKQDAHTAGSPPRHLHHRH